MTVRSPCNESLTSFLTAWPQPRPNITCYLTISYPLRQPGIMHDGTACFFWPVRFSTSVQIACGTLFDPVLSRRGSRHGRLVGFRDSALRCGARRLGCAVNCQSSAVF